MFLIRAVGGEHEPPDDEAAPILCSSSAHLSLEQQLRFNRPDAGHEPVHLGHERRLVLGGLGFLRWISAVSLPVNRVSGLPVERVLAGVQAAQLLGQPCLIYGDEVPRRDQASPPSACMGSTIALPSL